MDTQHAANGTSEEAILHTELEVLIAEMETRLRRAVLKVVRPTLDEGEELSARVSSISRKVERHEVVLDHSDKLDQKVDSLTTFFGTLKEQALLSDDQARSFASQTNSALLELRSRAMSSETRLDSIESELKKIERNFGRVWEETQRLQWQHNDAVQSIWSGINNAQKNMDKQRDELVERITALHTAHLDFVEDVYGDGKSFQKVHQAIQQLQSAVEPVPKLEEQIDVSIEATYAMEDKVRVVGEKCEQVLEKINTMSATTEERFTTHVEDNAEVMNKLTAYHASLLRNIRSDYLEEIESSRQVREEMTKFESKTGEICSAVMDSLRQEILRVDALYKEIVTDIQAVDHRRVKDRAAIDSHIWQLEVDTQKSQEVSESHHANLEHFNKVLALVLEGERMASALHIQEYADRCAECWLAPPTDVKKKRASALTAHGLDGLKTHLGRGFASEDMASLVPIDVNHGLAKLGYQPGPIRYAHSEFDRKGFLLMHHQMLSKAKGYLDRAPKVPHSMLPRRLMPNPEVDEEDHSPTIAAQPSAKGGQSGSEVPGSWKTSGLGGISEDPSRPPGSFHAADASSSNGIGQRPGSQHQPQAMGSRGTMPGPLGPTSPSQTQPDPADLGDRLPRIRKVRKNEKPAVKDGADGPSLEYKRRSLNLNLHSKAKALDSARSHSAR